jgi:hypothetical protein
MLLHTPLPGMITSILLHRHLPLGMMMTALRQAQRSSNRRLLSRFLHFLVIRNKAVHLWSKVNEWLMLDTSRAAEGAAEVPPGPAGSSP